jgi:hypothetical protein
VKRVHRIAVDVPEFIDTEDLFTAIADAVHDWEPDERHGWDTDITGYRAEVPDGDESGCAACGRPYDSATERTR